MVDGPATFAAPPVACSPAMESDGDDSDFELSSDGVPLVQSRLSAVKGVYTLGPGKVSITPRGRDEDPSAWEPLADEWS